VKKSNDSHYQCDICCSVYCEIVIIWMHYSVVSLSKSRSAFDQLSAPLE